MKRFFSVILLLALLTGCSAPARTPAESTPSGSAPAAEHTRLTSYLGSSDYAYGLMTTDGEIVTPADYEVRLTAYSGGAWGEQFLWPVWEVSREGPGWPENQAFVALYAEDGSWQTDFVYHGCTATPLGLFVGNESGAFLLDPEDGRELKSWTWEQLQIGNPMEYPWVTGDAYATAQWTGERLFLGDYEGKALLLDLETDAVEVLTTEKWCAMQDERWSRPYDWTANLDGQTVTVTHYEQEQETETRFELPVEAYCVFAETKDGVPRVYWNARDYKACAVCTPEGEEIIPVQSGEAWVLGFYDRPNRGFNVQNPEEGTVKIYDWDGNLQFTLPMRESDYVTMNGSLIQITDYRTSSVYYDPETGEKVAEFTF